MRPLTKEGEEMKLQNMAVIFLIIVIPIVLLLSYYISLQIDTLNMQASYNTKLLQAAKEAISSFEINTVEWNEAYSETADSKRRDITASINSFITSFANGMGIGGIGKERILPYIPAIAYTLYDGYYIYSPSETKETIKNSNGVTVFMDEKLTIDKTEGINENIVKGYNYDKSDNGKVLYQYDSKKGGKPDGTYDGKQFTLNSDYAKSTYAHILKPFSYYSARYKNGNADIAVNYTLDNYINIYGIVNGSYVAKSGYLINTANVKSINENSFQGITVEKDNITAQIDKETLTEKIAWKQSEKAPYNIGIYTYVYASDNTKVYFDGNTPFQVNSSGIRVNLNELTSVKYKKLVLLRNKVSGECIEVYQALVNGNYEGKTISAGKWYIDTKGKEYPGGVNGIDIKEDISSINYYVEAYSFTTWANRYLSTITVDDMQGDKNGISIKGKIFDANNDPEDESSIFAQHKREIIKQVVISSLNQSITSYSRNSEGTYRLPVLVETDWDQILSNVSIIAFVQNVPIGLKSYNNYVVATSTSNKEYVDPDEIYLSVTDDEYYHLPYCKQIDVTKNMIGYRSIDYIEKYYNEGEDTKYYYKHEDISNKADYYCLVQNSLYQKESNVNKTKAYQTALARERYVTHSFKK